MTEEQIRKLLFGNEWHSVPYNEESGFIGGAQQGWICPRCGRVNAPWMAQCTCSREELKVTCGTNNEGHMTVTTKII